MYKFGLDQEIETKGDNKEFCDAVNIFNNQPETFSHAVVFQSSKAIFLELKHWYSDLSIEDSISYSHNFYENNNTCSVVLSLSRSSI